MASLETDIKGLNRLKTIWAMIRGRRLVIHFPDQVVADAIARAATKTTGSNVDQPGDGK